MSHVSVLDSLLSDSAARIGCGDGKYAIHVLEKLKPCTNSMVTVPGIWKKEIEPGRAELESLVTTALGSSYNHTAFIENI